MPVRSGYAYISPSYGQLAGLMSGTGAVVSAIMAVGSLIAQVMALKQGDSALSPPSKLDELDRLEYRLRLVEEELKRAKDQGDKKPQGVDENLEEIGGQISKLHKSAAYSSYPDQSGEMAKRDDAAYSTAIGPPYSSAAYPSYGVER